MATPFQNFQSNSQDSQDFDDTEDGTPLFWQSPSPKIGLAAPFFLAILEHVQTHRQVMNSPSEVQHWLTKTMGIQMDIKIKIMIQMIVYDDL